MGDKDFFLSPDDAMTMGDIDYMRTSKRTRRTFPKTLKNKDGFALENEVSSVENRNNSFQASNTNQNTAVNTAFNPTPSTQAQAGITGGSAVNQNESLNAAAAPAPAPAPAKRRPADNSMDMFRNMAKNIRK